MNTDLFDNSNKKDIYVQGDWERHTKGIGYVEPVSTQKSEALNFLFLLIFYIYIRTHWNGLKTLNNFYFIYYTFLIIKTGRSSWQIWDTFEVIYFTEIKLNVLSPYFSTTT